MTCTLTQRFLFGLSVAAVLAGVVVWVGWDWTFGHTVREIE